MPKRSPATQSMLDLFKYQPRPEHWRYAPKPVDRNVKRHSDDFRRKCAMLAYASTVIWMICAATLIQAYTVCNAETNECHTNPIGIILAVLLGLVPTTFLWFSYEEKMTKKKTT